MGEGIESGVLDFGDSEVLRVSVAESCYERCRKLIDKLDDLFDTSNNRETNDLALICEGKGFLRPCHGIVVRTAHPSSVIAGPFFDKRNRDEVELFEDAVEQNGVECLEFAWPKVKK